MHVIRLIEDAGVQTHLDLYWQEYTYEARHIRSCFWRSKLSRIVFWVFQLYVEIRLLKCPCDIVFEWTDFLDKRSIATCAYWVWDLNS